MKTHRGQRDPYWRIRKRLRKLQERFEALAARARPAVPALRLFQPKGGKHQ